MDAATQKLPDDIATLKALLLAERQKNEIARQRIVVLEELMRRWQKRAFGPSSEQWTGQPCLFNESEEAAAAAAPLTQRIAQHERNRPKRRPLPADLPHVDVVHALDDDARTCDCGGELFVFGEAVSEQLNVIPAKIEVIRHRRLKYACASCKSCIKTAPMPPQPLPKTNASAGLLAYVATSKYVDGLPLHRQEEIFRRLGIDMPRSTLARWMIDLAELLRPLYNLLQDDLLDSPVMVMDETPVQVLKGTGKKPTAQSYMWVRCRAGPEKPIVLFHYDPGRGAGVARELLAGFEGYLVTDGYEVYNAVAAARPSVVQCGCWDHARRRFHDAAKHAAKSGDTSLAEIGLSYIQALYAVERGVKDADMRRRVILRGLYSRSILDHLKAWLDRVIDGVALKTLTGKALHYLRAEWPKLVRFLDDGRIPLSNAQAENAIRPFAIGRKAWLFSDTRAGADASAMIYSLVETAKAGGHEPYAYLRDVIARLPAAKTAEAFEALLPFNWRALS